MKKTAVLTVMMAALVISGLSVSRADSAKDHFGFVGLWGNVDPEDGSTGLLSIFPDDTGGFRLVWQSSSFLFCADVDGNGAGFASGTGVIEDGALTSEDRVIHCANGELISSPVVLVPDKRHDLFRMEFPPTRPREPITYHRLSSSRPRGR